MSAISFSAVVTMNLIGYNSSPKYSPEIGHILICLYLLSGFSVIARDDFMITSVQELPKPIMIENDVFLMTYVTAIICQKGKEVWWMFYEI